MARRPSKTFPLLKYADVLVEQIHKLLPKAIEDHDESAIHHSRVATRRLKAAMDVLEPVLTQKHRKSFAKILKNLRSKLGPLRDADVMAGHLGEVAGTSLKAGRQWVQALLDRQRDDLRTAAARKVKPAKVIAKLSAWWNVRKELEESKDAVDSLLAESLHLQLDAFVEQAGAMIRNNVDVDPHQLRIEGKALRYTLELALVEGHKLPASVMRTFKKMQDALGLWHDFVVLAESVMQIAVKQQLPLHNAELCVQVIEIVRNAVRKSSKEMAMFSSLWKANGQQLTETIRTAFPLTRPSTVTLPRTDHDPSHLTDTLSPDIPSPAEPSASTV